MLRPRDARLRVREEVVHNLGAAARLLGAVREDVDPGGLLHRAGEGERGVRGGAGRIGDDEEFTGGVGRAKFGEFFLRGFGKEVSGCDGFLSSATVREEEKEKEKKFS